MNLSAASNFRWLGLAQIGRVVIQSLSVIIFARLLRPEDYGLMAMAAVVMNFGLLFRDIGTSSALIQTKELTEELLDSVMLVNVIFGVAFGALVALGAPLGARLFSADALTGVLVALAIMFPISSTTAPHLALLERNGRFRDIARIEIISALAGFFAGVTLALLGGGVYSIVAQTVLTAAVSALLLWYYSDWRPGRRWSIGALGGIWRFSGNLVIFNLMMYVTRNADSALIGRVLGPVPLGWYSVASRLLLLPLQNVNFMVHRAFLPVYSRSQDNIAQIGALYLRTLATIAAVSAPAMFGLWVCRDLVVSILLGPKWMPVAEILAWFAPMAFVQTLNFTTGTILTAIGRTDRLKNLGVANAAITIGAFIVGMQFGLTGIVQAYFFATLIGTAISLQVTLRSVKSTVPQMMRSIGAPVLCAAAMATVAWGINYALQGALPDVLRLVAVVVVGAIIYVWLIAWFLRPLFTELLRHSGLWQLMRD